MSLRKDFELLTFNILETVIDYGTFEVGLNVFCIMLCLGMAPEDSCLSKPMGSQGVECDGLYMLSPGSGTIRRCGPVGVGVVLLEWTFHCGGEL